MSTETRQIFLSMFFLIFMLIGCVLFLDHRSDNLEDQIDELQEQVDELS